MADRTCPQCKKGTLVPRQDKLEQSFGSIPTTLWECATSYCEYKHWEPAGFWKKKKE